MTERHCPYCGGSEIWLHYLQPVSEKIETWKPNGA